MAAEARAVRFQLGNIEVSGYQLTSDETATALVEAANSISVETLQIEPVSDIEPVETSYPKDIEGAIAELPQIMLCRCYVNI